MEEKRRGIEAMARTVVPGGEVHVADYARQRSRLMRTLFGLVQRLDGAENTEPNARGAIEAILARSEEHTSELQSLMRISYAVFCLTKKNKKNNTIKTTSQICTITLSTT